MKAFLFLVLVAVVSAEDSCPAWHDWRAWTDECLFFKDGGLDYMRQKWLDACDISVVRSLCKQLQAGNKFFFSRRSSARDCR